MSIAIMSAVWSRSAQASGNLLVLLALADFADDEGFCYPAVKTIAAKARITERHARRVIRELEEAGEIQVAANAGRAGSNRYRVTPPERLETGFACTLCLTHFPSAEWLDDHHKQPTSLGGDDTPENRQTLCRACHRKMHVSGSATLTPLGELLRDEGIEAARTYVSPDKMSVGGHTCAKPLTRASANPDVGVSQTIKEPSEEPSQSLLDADPVFSHELKQAAASAVTVDQIYAAYPRKVAPQAAKKAIAKVLKDVPGEVLLAKVQAYAAAVAQWDAEAKQFIPHPATWFNRGSYEDDPAQWQRKGAARRQGRTGGDFTAAQYSDDPFGEHAAREATA